ncbi:MAG: ABC transporter substrate-binding protein, partial [Methanophagales archaeon]|nr:ABC transporter substrate-binding protein [Methanophagales archaeon]
VGKEKELTLVDPMERIVTVSKPIKSIVVLKTAVIEMVRSLGAKDKLNGIGYYEAKEKRHPRFFGDLYHLPSVGAAGATIDREAILNLNPDLVLLDAWTGHDSCAQVLEDAGIPVYRLTGYPGGASLGFTKDEDYVQEIKKLGYMLDKKKEAEDFSNWFHGFVDKIAERVSGLSDDEKPRTYFEYHRDYCSGSTGTSSYMNCVEFAGGKNIFGADISPALGPRVRVDPEAVLVRDPEIIVTCRGQACNYEIDDPSEAKAIREAITNRPGFDKVTAVKEGKVYILPASFMPIYGGAPCHWFIGMAYLAKLFHPGLFEDLDPEEIHQEYLTRFQRIDYNVYEQGVFVYPPFEN